MKRWIARVVMAAIFAAGLGVIGSAPAHAKPAKPATGSVEFANIGTTYAGRYNATADEWRGASGVYTPVYKTSYSSGVYTIQDANTGNYMTAKTQSSIGETSDIGAARAHWAIFGCDNGFTCIRSVYYWNQGTFWAYLSDEAGTQGLILFPDDNDYEHWTIFTP